MIEPKTTLCPFARTFAAKEADPFCRGPACAIFRWEKVTTAHPKWKPAVQAKAAETGEKPPYVQASKWVAENKADLGVVPERGFCGAGGEP